MEVFVQSFIHVRGFQWRQSRMYEGLLKERLVHLKKCASIGSNSSTGIVRFVCSVYSLSGPFSLLREP
jgi:hypothetical protein